MIFESYAHDPDEYLTPKSGFLGYFAVNYDSDDTSSTVSEDSSPEDSEFSLSSLYPRRSSTPTSSGGAASTPGMRRMLMLSSYRGYDEVKERKKVSFSDSCEIYVTFAMSEYDRRPCAVNKKRRRSRVVVEEEEDDGQAGVNESTESPPSKSNLPRADDESALKHRKSEETKETLLQEVLTLTVLT